MSRLADTARLVAAVAELGTMTGDGMPVAVVDRLLHSAPNSIIAARSVALVIGYDVVSLNLPTHPRVTVAEAGNSFSAELAYAKDRPLILFDATDFDADDQRHVDIVKGLATIARGQWSIDGSTALLVIVHPGDAPAIRQLIAEAIDTTNRH